MKPLINDVLFPVLEVTASTLHFWERWETPPLKHWNGHAHTVLTAAAWVSGPGPVELYILIYLTTWAEFLLPDYGRDLQASFPPPVVCTVGILVVPFFVKR